MATFEFRNLEKIVPDAYHGTLKQNVESILKDGFHPGRSFELHLGSGVYFYESSRAWAEHWAQEKFNAKGDGLEIAVLMAEIRLGRCIDLCDRDNQKVLDDFEQEVKNRIRNGGMAGTFSNITAAYIYNLASQRSNADTIRKPYGPPEDTSDRWAGIRWTMRLVICVRKLENISNVRVV